MTQDASDKDTPEASRAEAQGGLRHGGAALSPLPLALWPSSGSDAEDPKNWVGNVPFDSLLRGHVTLF